MKNKLNQKQLNQPQTTSRDQETTPKRREDVILTIDEKTKHPEEVLELAPPWTQKRHQIGCLLAQWRFQIGRSLPQWRHQFLHLLGSSQGTEATKGGARLGVSLGQVEAPD